MVGERPPRERFNTARLSTLIRPAVRAVAPEARVACADMRIRSSGYNNRSQTHSFER